MAPQMSNWIRESNLIEGVDDPAEDARSLKAWNWLLTQPRLDHDIVLKLHGRIMRRLLPSHAGRYRRVPIWIGRQEGLNWQQIWGAMSQWLDANRTTAEAIQAAHVAFERIHPFVDGNGRTGRMLMNWQRVTSGLEPLCIKAAERQAYYAWFQEAPNA